MEPLRIRKAVIIVATTLLCIGLLWLLGFGFGNEARLSRETGFVLFGSEVYTGTWFIFMLFVPVGIGIPALVIRLVLRERVRDYGLSLGEAKAGALWLLVLIPAYVYLPLVSAAIGTERYYDYLLDPAFTRPLRMAFHSASYAAFALGFEFLFRGFVLFGLSAALGGSDRARWTAIGVSGVLSALCLVGLPWVFPVSALLSSLPGGWLNLRLRSFAYFAFVHWNFGVWSDVWEIVKLNVADRLW